MLRNRFKLKCEKMHWWWIEKIYSMVRVIKQRDIGGAGKWSTEKIRGIEKRYSMVWGYSSKVI